MPYKKDKAKIAWFKGPSALKRDLTLHCQLH